MNFNEKLKEAYCEFESKYSKHELKEVKELLKDSSLLNKINHMYKLLNNDISFSEFKINNLNKHQLLGELDKSSGEYRKKIIHRILDNFDVNEREIKEILLKHKDVLIEVRTENQTP